jgi:hypothetical protein
MSGDIMMSTNTDPLERALDVAAHIERHPLGTLAAAVGAGYVLGGGLFTPLTERLVKTVLRVGLRFVVMPVLERELIGAAQSLFAGGDEAPGEPAAAKDSTKPGANNGSDRAKVTAPSA